MRLNLSFPVLFPFLIQTLFAAKPALISGPMQGYTTPASAKVWLLVKSTHKVRLTLHDANGLFVLEAFTDTMSGLNKITPLTFEFKGLQPETKYEVSVELDGKDSGKKFSVQTLGAATVKDFSFLLGSCAFLPPKIFRLFYPGRKEKIFDSMSSVGGDFMFWLGDNVYYRQFPASPYKVMFRSNLQMRTNRRIRSFLTSIPQCAIWDDHDYGTNNSDSSYCYRKDALKIAKMFWPNAFFGTSETPGNYCNFRMYDAEFFMLDDRYYRKQCDSVNSSLMGQKQLDWFFATLKLSTATFKFVAVGTQVISIHSTHEYFAQFPDRQKIFDFIKDNAIGGVIFLTGDIHHSVITKHQLPGFYPFYDFTCSPLTSIVHTQHPHEYNNTQVVNNKFAIQHNFGHVAVTGPSGSRKCVIETRDSFGKKIWDFEITEQELR